MFLLILRKLAKSTLILLPFFSIYYIVFSWLTFSKNHISVELELIKLYFEIICSSFQVTTSFTNLSEHFPRYNSILKYYNKTGPSHILDLLLLQLRGPRRASPHPQSTDPNLQRPQILQEEQKLQFLSQIINQQ